MRPSIILRTVALGILYVILLFAVFMFFRGHNQPGGGFIAGLIAGVMILVAYISTDRFTLQTVFKPVFHRIMAAGLLITCASGLFGLLGGDPFFASYKWVFEFSLLPKLEVPSVLFFDVGVFFVVVGTIITVFQTIDEDRSEETKLP